MWFKSYLWVFCKVSVLIVSSQFIHSWPFGSQQIIIKKTISRLYVSQVGTCDFDFRICCSKMSYIKVHLLAKLISDVFSVWFHQSLWGSDGSRNSPLFSIIFRCFSLLTIVLCVSLRLLLDNLIEWEPNRLVHHKKTRFSWQQTDFVSGESMNQWMNEWINQSIN
jgi:hypothetical protein